MTYCSGNVSLDLSLYVLGLIITSASHQKLETNKQWSTKFTTPSCLLQMINIAPYQVKLIIRKAIFI